MGSESSAAAAAVSSPLSVRHRRNCVVHAAREARVVARLPAPGFEHWVQAGEAGQARAGAETQLFFWELAEAGVGGGGSEKPAAPEATGVGCGGGKGNR